MRTRFLPLLVASLALLGTPASAVQDLHDAATGYPPAAVATWQAGLASAEMLEARLAGGGILALRAGLFDPLAEPAPDFAARGFVRRAPEGTDVWVVQFRRPLTEAEWYSLDPSHLRFLEYLPQNAYLVRADGIGLDFLRKHRDFRWLDLWQAAWKVDPMLTLAGWDQPVILQVRLFPDENPFPFFETMAKLEPKVRFVAVQGEIGSGVTLRILVPADRLGKFLPLLAAPKGVRTVDPWFLPHVMNDNSIYVVQSYDTANKLNYATCATIWNHGITGTGQLPAVADTGLDDDMCFFKYNAGGVTDSQAPTLPGIGTPDPTKKVQAYYVIPGASAYDGNTTCGTSAEWWHGTHVVASVLGDNFATLSTPTSGGHDTGDGMAPNAKVNFQDVGNETTGCLDGLATDNYLIFQQAWNAGSRIHSNSWGGDTAGVYTADCELVDRFTWDHEDFSLFFASGNAGSGAQTVGSPAAAKNCVTIGATTNGSGGANAMASFSSRGPTADQRRKPDVSTPGSSIISASGTTSHTDNNCSTKSGDGTSMATPTAAGAGTLLRQYFVDGFYPTGAKTAADAAIPSAALLKAALVNGAVDISATTQAAILNTLVPDNAQGWGRLLLDTVAFFSTPSRDARRTRVWDRWNATGLSTGQQEEFPIQVAAGQAFKVALVWTDPQAASAAAVTLVNNLDLEVVGPSSQTYLGNNFTGGQSVTGGTADSRNNVEVFFLTAPSAGLWTIRVKATSVPGTPAQPYSTRQGFALVATYADCATSLAAPSTFGATNNGTTGIDLAWSGVAGATAYQVYRASGDCSAAAGTYHYIGRASGTTFTDTLVNGGYTYAYRVRAVDNCNEGSASTCSSATYSGNCRLYPTFSGIATVTNDTATTGCDLLLSWSAAASNCPLGNSVTYNVYRGTSPYYTLGAGSRIATGLAATSFRDTAVTPNTTYFYVVRAEDGTTVNSGPANGGNEDLNTRMLMATPTAASSSAGTWSDAAGDSTLARLSLDSPWRVTNQQNHTAGGAFAYHAGPDGASYPPNTCASATAGPVALQAGQSPVLTYWTRFNLEYQWDGVVVEISTNGGTNWTIIAPTGGYPSDFSQTTSPPVNACAYPSTQTAFSGPSGNSALSAWTQYTHPLSTFAGQTALIRWRFSSDPGSEFEGFYLDDIQITYASVPDGCAVSNGIFTIDRATYGCAGIGINLSVIDSDLVGTGTTTANAKSTTESGGGETVTLTENPASSGHFTGSIATTTAPAAADGLLSVANGDTITLTWIDASDGSGGTNVVKTRTATADCIGPTISNVTITSIASTSALVGWTTSEAADSRVTWGTSAPPATNTDASPLVTSHQITLSGLTPCTLYYVSVRSIDPSGNVSTDTNGGAWYQFTTLALSSPNYTSADTPLAIPDSNTTGITSTITVVEAKTVTDVNVTVNITHTYDGDLQISLIPPIGSAIPLSTSRGSSGDNFTNTVFDDEASTAISAGTAPFTGSFKPESPLSAMDGFAAPGAWKLKVVDSAGGDTGTLLNWTLSLTYPPQACGPHAKRQTHARTADTCSAGGAGNNNGYWDAGELVQFSLTLANDGTVPLTGVTATVSSTTPGVSMVDDTASFADIAVGGTAASLDPHFTVQLSSSIACDDRITFQVAITTDQGSWSDSFTQKTGNFPSSSTTLLSEAFTGGIPATWTVVNGGTGGNAAQTWTTTNPGSRTIAAPFSAPFAIVDSDNAASGATQDEELITPVLNLSTALTASVDFDNQFRYYTGSLAEKCDVDVRSSLTAGAWVNKLRLQGTSDGYTTPNHKTVDITAEAAGAADVQVRFHYYTASFEYWWAIDNVQISITQPTTCSMPVCATATPNPKEASPSGNPMKLSLPSGSATPVDVTWTAGCGATTHAVYRATGQAGQAPAWSTSFCSLGTAGSASFDPGDPPAGGFYCFVIVAQNATKEGSYGKTSSGSERAEATGFGACDLSQDLTGSCP
jgi:subtilisin-like proprotein convertase family protein